MERGARACLAGARCVALENSQCGRAEAGVSRIADWAGAETVKRWMNGAASVLLGPTELSSRADYLSAAGHVTDRRDARCAGGLCGCARPSRQETGVSRGEAVRSRRRWRWTWGSTG